MAEICSVIFPGPSFREGNRFSNITFDCEKPNKLELSQITSCLCQGRCEIISLFIGFKINSTSYDAISIQPDVNLTMSKKLLAHIALFAANLIYGANYIVAKEAMPEYIAPFGFILIRVIGATLLFWFIWSTMIREKVARSDFLRLAACGLFGVAINQLLFFKGLSITTPINAAIIMTSNPVVVMLFSIWILKEAITVQKITGLLIGLTGAILLIIAGSGFSFSSDTFRGDLMVFINAASYALYLVIVKPLMVKYHPITIVTWIFTFGLIIVIPLGYQELLAVEWGSFTPTIWAAVSFVVVFTTFLAYLLNVSALKQLSPAIVSYYIYLQPLLAAMIALYFEKDHLTLVKTGAALLIFAGVYLVSTQKTNAISNSQ